MTNRGAHCSPLLREAGFLTRTQSLTRDVSASTMSFLQAICRSGGAPVRPNYLRYISICLCIFGFISLSQAEVLTSSDLYKLRNVGSVALSPDGHYIAYTITMHDVHGRPYGQLWVMDLNTQKSTRLGGDNPAGGPLWSADSKWIAFHGQDGDKHGLLIAHPDGRGSTFLAEMKATNSPLPGTGKD